MTNSAGIIAQTLGSIDPAQFSWQGGQHITIANTKPNHAVTFKNDQNQQVGELDFNGPELVFTGDASASAQVFIRYLSTVFRDRLSAERNLLIEAIEQIGFATDEQRLTAKIIVEFLKSVDPYR
jgi:hypothetical protein